MNISTKLLKAAAGQGGGAGLDVDEVFSTHLYTGSSGSKTVTNNIDFSNEGGLLWIKNREASQSHYLFDTERGAGKGLRTNGNFAEYDYGSSSGFNHQFTSTGFSFNTSDGAVNNGDDFVSWTFRKAPKFFDVITWTGDGTSNRTLSHSLGSIPGMIIAKSTSTTTEWMVWHTAMVDNEFLRLNTKDAQGGYGSFYEAGITSTTIGVSSTSANYGMNINNATYVAYIFAHNNSDGEFGPNQDQNVIKCGGYTGNGSTTGPVIDLGFEPQFIMLKKTNASQNAHWYVFDSMRGIVTGGDDEYLYWNRNDAGVAGNVLEVTPTGFQLKDSSNGFNGSSDTYIYMAIRRGPLAAPTDATKVFAIDTMGATSPTPPLWNSGFPVDMAYYKNRSSSSENVVIGSRLIQGKYLRTDTADAEATLSSMMFDYQNGFYNGTGTGSNYISHMWKRAPGYFDVVAYTGTGTAGLTVNHNLGVAPEMTWVKRRDSTTHWRVNVAALGTNGQNSPVLRLNLSNASEDDNGSYFGNNNSGGYAAPTSSVLTLGGHGDVNASGGTYIAYLFATVAGVSKVGSYTGNGSTQNIDCGFSSGARFVLIKRTDAAQDWAVFDTVRGIVSGNDPYLKLNNTEAETTGYDVVDPYSAGFSVGPQLVGVVNDSGGSYIFYAIA